MEGFELIVVGAGEEERSNSRGPPQQLLTSITVEKLADGVDHALISESQRPILSQNSPKSRIRSRSKPTTMQGAAEAAYNLFQAVLRR